MSASLLITLREGMEASLILGIVFAYLARTGNQRRFAAIWLGTVAAIVVSLGAAAAIFLTVGELEGGAEEIFEGTAMFLAVAMLSYVVVWMKRQASGLRGELQERVKAALAEGSGLALAFLAFVVVVREGLETALFFYVSTRASGFLESVLGGALGLAAAAILGYSIYRGSHRLNLRAFFNVTGVLLILFAAGLLAHGIHEYQEVELLPEGVEHIWDTNGFLNQQSTLGRFLTALVGYNGSPSLVEVLAYMAYLGASLAYYFRTTDHGLSRSSTRPPRAA